MFSTFLGFQRVLKRWWLVLLWQVLPRGRWFFCFFLTSLPSKCHLRLTVPKDISWVELGLIFLHITEASACFLWPNCVFLRRYSKEAFLADSSMYISLIGGVLTLQGLVTSILNSYLPKKLGWNVYGGGASKKGQSDLVGELCPSDLSSGVLWRRAAPGLLECKPRVHRRSRVPEWGVSHSWHIPGS